MLPTPPAAAVITTRSPRRMRPTVCRAWSAVRPVTASAAPSTNPTRGGSGRTWVAGTRTSSACPPKMGTAATGVPTAGTVTPSPRAATTPLTSIPGTKGGRGTLG